MPSRFLSLLCAVVLSSLPGCGGDGGPGGGGDGGPGPRPDAAATDGGLPDGSLPDGSSVPDAGPTECPLLPACDAPLPDLGGTSSWRHSISSPIVTATGAPNHRGRDLYLLETDEQWALGKFAYGLTDKDLEDEDVDMYLLRDCAGTWEPLGTATTTVDGTPHAPVEGVADTGGRVYFQIPTAARLGPGRHRILFVVRGDHTMANQFIEVLPPDARFVVTDMDGTQTASETAAFTSLLTGTDPGAQPFGADLLTHFARRGLHVFYLTARPEWLATKTHEWLDAYAYPPGNVHTTLTLTGAMGAAAQSFKTDELTALEARFPGGVQYTIGNTDTDAGAYAAIGVPPDRSYLYQFDPGAIGTRVDDYSTLFPVADLLPAFCR